MARLRKADHEDAAFTNDIRQASGGKHHASGTQTSLRSSPRNKSAKPYLDHLGVSGSASDEQEPLQPKGTPKAAVSGKQRRLAPLQAASLSKPFQIQQPLLLPDVHAAKLEPRRCNMSLFSRKLPSPAKKAVETPPLLDPSDAGDDVEVEVEESIWCGSDASTDSEDELPSPRKFLQLLGKPNTKISPQNSGANGGEQDLAQRLANVRLGDDHDRERSHDHTAVSFGDIAKDASRPVSSSDKEDNGAVLRFSPPRLSRLYSPPKHQYARPVTPPQSPTKSRLQSPTKAKTRVPSPRIRQSLDAFWNAETVNEWNDQYSPRKVLKSPKKLRLVQEQSSSPTASPRKAQSPSKRTKAEREAKQAFEDKKHATAEAFLTELDDTITTGKIRVLAASTGGVRFIWSKTLNATAGRANWRRETTSIRNLDGSTETRHKHHASIELAEKVINDEHRLLNVIAHEFCHLANFMVSGIKDQPHGAQFKAWGRMCTKAFGERGVEVTTKHSYEIEYKYIWQCSSEDCGSEFKRHSKSIDPKRHTCGSCRSKLIQVKPTPRAANKNGDGKGFSEGKQAGGFAAFVKLHFASTKAFLPPGSSQKTVMEALGKAYRAEKAVAAATGQASSGRQEDAVAGRADPARSTGVKYSDDGMERLAEGIEVVELDDDSG